MSSFWEGHRVQHDLPCYGMPFGLGSTVAVPGPMVFNMGIVQDCVDHVRLQHHGSMSVKASTIGKCFPPWTVTRTAWNATLKQTVSDIATDIMLFSQHGPDWFTGTVCLEVLCRTALFEDRSRCPTSCTGPVVRPARGPNVVGTQVSSVAC